MSHNEEHLSRSRRVTDDAKPEPRGERRRESRRRADQQQLRKIVQRLPDGIVIVDGEGRIRFANPSAECLFQRPAAELEHRPLGSPLVAGENVEIDVIRPTGQTVTVELRVVEIDWDGAPALLVSLRDVTDRKQADEHARQLERERARRAQAEAASQAKSEFLAMMSHELRTPLNAVIGYAELLDLGVAGSLNDEQRHQVARIQASGRHLLGLVNEVLDLAKVEAGQLTIETSVNEAGQTCDAALSLIQPHAEAKAITLAGPSPTEVAVRYEGDEDRTRQILVNLLSNAVKFTPPGGRVELECGVTWRPDATARLVGGTRPWAFMRVHDTGIGIPAGRLSAIFEPFVQVSTGHTRTQDGSGLGLTISRRLARLMGGDITATSELDHGSVFTLWLPAAAPARAPQPVLTERADESHVRGLAEVGEALLRELTGALDAFVSRLRGEPVAPAARTLKFSQLADHVPSYVADIASLLIAIDEHGGQPSSLITDGALIQRLVAERHGAQRARIGWTEATLRRECAILREELERAVRRGARDVPPRAMEEALTILERFLTNAEELSVRALLRATRTGSRADR